MGLMIPARKGSSWIGRLLECQSGSRLAYHLRTPGPEQPNRKIQVLYLVSLRSQKAILSLPQVVPIVPSISCGVLSCSPVLFPN